MGQKERCLLFTIATCILPMVVLLLMVTAEWKGLRLTPRAREEQKYRHACLAGSRVRFFREQQGLSTTELARKAGFAQQQISKVELGKINTPIETLARLAEALEVPLSELVGTVNEELPDGQAAWSMQVRAFQQFYEQYPHEVWAQMSGMFARLAACRDACEDSTGDSQLHQSFSSQKYGAYCKEDQQFASRLCYS